MAGGAATEYDEVASSRNLHIVLGLSTDRTLMRLGIYGGSFDPVHKGHLALAGACQHQTALDEVWFVPTAVQPLKQRGPHATDAQRLDMLQLAIHSEPSWRICRLEIERGGLSYTIDTLRKLDEELPDAVLFFMIGADATKDVPHWREPHEIFRLATPLVVRRAGQAEPDLAALRAICGTNKQPQLVEMPAVDVSSTEIRGRAAEGEPLGDLVPESVARYIRDQGIYCQGHGDGETGRQGEHRC
jgi:nicotinate-nucleotide adenylyltransferase